MESIFTRIYTYRPRENKKPEEDFFTEVFAGVMERHPTLLSHLLKKLINIETNEKSLTIRTQVSLSSIDPIGFDRPDIVIEGSTPDGQSIIIFVENKIGSKEGANQLSSYVAQLSNWHQSVDKRYLLYVTRYPENKDESKIVTDKNSEVIFKQFRWHEVYKFLSSYRVRMPLLIELLTFMEDKKMALKLDLFDLITTLSAKKNEQVYWDILDEAWNTSNIHKSFKNQEIKGGNRAYLNDMNQLSVNTSYVTEDKLRINFGFWFNHSEKPEILESFSENFPFLFVAVSNYENASEYDKIINNLKSKKEIIKLSLDHNWKWKIKKDKDYPWFLFGKSIDMCDIHKASNLAEFLIVKIKDELDRLDYALFKGEH